ncbi:hypothetical protein GCM10018781_56380 [Kitasatospora indigofera]|uniref:Uncharacterized protein n=1 Tax=Kitasatospora indigofera TaxID=67307 RepID=A0A919G6S9_9ACTN|nr:hypothetical protein GCM10018781_56380 [Kitasatospora indigofera]
MLAVGQARFIGLDDDDLVACLVALGKMGVGQDVHAYRRPFHLGSGRILYESESHIGHTDGEFERGHWPGLPEERNPWSSGPIHRVLWGATGYRGRLPPESAQIQRTRVAIIRRISLGGDQK